MDLVREIEKLLAAFWEIWLEFAPWLLIGLLAAGLIKAWVSMAAVQRWLGGRGPLAVLRAAIIGTPLPLCSCSVLPAAVQLKRSGASRGSTVSFLIATPENGVDSIAVSYVLLGPFLTIARPVAAILSAVTTGLATELLPHRRTTNTDDAPAEGEPAAPCCEDSGCCDTRQATPAQSPSQPPTADSCCGNDTDCCPSQRDTPSGFWRRTASGLRYAATTLFADLATWLLIGLVLAAAIKAYIPPDALAQWGSGLLAMLVMIAIGVPMYICATSSTPIAAALLAAGVSPGAALVFLLAGPATNIASLGVIRRELGTSVAIVYLLGIAITSILLGLLTDLIARGIGFSYQATVAAQDEMIPPAISIVSACFLLLLFGYHYFARLRRRISASAAATPATE